MTQKITAIFDGKVFRPEGPVDLKPDSEVELFVTTPDEKPTGKKSKPYSLLRTVAAMNLEGPADWSEHFEDYLNGTREAKQ
jgi:hypothetical protein